MKMNVQVDVAIPVYHAGKQLQELIDRLNKQSIQIDKIFLLHTEDGMSLKSVLEAYDNVIEVMVAKKDFDHGATRHIAMIKSTAPIVIFMTQDAVPADRYLISELVKPLLQNNIVLSYARQLPRENSRLTERYIRYFNYPPESRTKSLDDLPILGIKTYFCSNVCAAYKREEYLKLGGFEKHIPLNEDMLYAAKCINHGWMVRYTADAKVIHSHNYTYVQQFKRNFDIAVSQAMYPEVFSGISSEKEGVSMVNKVICYLMKKKMKLIPYFLGECTAKFLGFQIGKHYKVFPRQIVRKLSLNPGFWD